MEIYIVKQGDTVYSIAQNYGISVDKLIIDNGLAITEDLIIGQALVIAIPKKTYTVKEGDTLQGIADENQVPLMQILRNNPFLFDQDNINSGEILTISYNTVGKITTNGFSYAFIKQKTLLKTLPSLTYLTIFNYTATLNGDIIEFTDEKDIIKMADDFHVIPLLMLTAIAPQGVPNIDLAYTFLFNVDFQELIMKNAIEIMKRKGYKGLDIVFSYLNEENQMLYYSCVERMSRLLKQEGFIFKITFNYHVSQFGNQISFDKIDYSKFSQYADKLTFLKFYWGTNYGAPAPISDINVVRSLVEYVTTQVPADKIMIGKPIMGFDWQLPYVPNSSSVVPLTIDTVLDTARDFDAIIQFDEETQTPYFYYDQYNIGFPFQHIVWFVDARSLDALDKLLIKYDLNGNGIWNIMIYNPQNWVIINASFDIVKLI